MGKMTDALKKARLIKEGKLPATAPVGEPVVEEPGTEGTSAPKTTVEKTAGRETSEKVVERKAQPAPKGPEPGSAAVRPAVEVTKKPSTMTALEPAGVTAEEFRALKQRVLGSMRTKRAGGGKSSSRVILVTGSGPAEGKTTVAANLALALGENAEYRVLLVDADLDKPGIPELFGLESGTGLAELLQGRASVAESTVSTGLNNLWVMSAGKARKSPEELLIPKQLQAALGQLTGAFRYVVVDGPAPTTVRQTAELAPVADAVLLVFRRSRSSKREAREAVKLIRNRGADILGCVLVD